MNTARTGIDWMVATIRVRKSSVVGLAQCRSSTTRSDGWLAPLVISSASKRVQGGGAHVERRQRQLPRRGCRGSRAGWRAAERPSPDPRRSRRALPATRVAVRRELPCDRAATGSRGVRSRGAAGCSGGRRSTARPAACARAGRDPSVVVRRSCSARDPALADPGRSCDVHGAALPRGRDLPPGEQPGELVLAADQRRQRDRVRRRRAG